MNSKNRKSPASTSEHSTQSAASVPAAARAAREARPVCGRNEAEHGRKDAPSTNRASDNSNEPEQPVTDEQPVPYFQALRWGVDSLYLSYPGELHGAILDRLKALKGLAQSAQPGEIAQAPGVRQFALKNAEFCPLSNVAMRVCRVFFVKVVWGHA